MYIYIYIYQLYIYIYISIIYICIYIYYIYTHTISYIYRQYLRIYLVHNSSSTLTWSETLGRSEAHPPGPSRAAASGGWRVRPRPPSASSSGTTGRQDDGTGWKRMEKVASPGWCPFFVGSSWLKHVQEPWFTVDISILNGIIIHF